MQRSPELLPLILASEHSMSTLDQSIVTKGFVSTDFGSFLLIFTPSNRNDIEARHRAALQLGT